MKYLVYFLIVGFYYYLGGDRFPDYQNYMTLLQNDISGGAEGRAIAEWIPKYYLRFFYYIGGGVAESVNALVVAIQIYFLYWILLIKKRCEARDSDGILNYILVMGPLLLTTTLRATPAYLGVAYFIAAKKDRKLSAVLILLIGVLSHDSAIIIITIMYLSYLMRKATFISKWSSLIIFLSALLSLVGENYFPSLQALLFQMNLGERSSYFSDASKISILKNVYWLFVGLVVHRAMNNAKDDWRAIFFVVSYAAFSFLFIINNVVAIRFVLFLLGSIILYQGGLLFGFTASNFKRLINVGISTALFVLSFLDILSNTGRA